MIFYLIQSRAHFRPARVNLVVFCCCCCCFFGRRNWPVGTKEKRVNNDELAKIRKAVSVCVITAARRHSLCRGAARAAGSRVHGECGSGRGALPLACGSPLPRPATHDTTHATLPSGAFCPIRAGQQGVTPWRARVKLDGAGPRPRRLGWPWRSGSQSRPAPDALYLCTPLHSAGTRGHDVLSVRARTFSVFTNASVGVFPRFGYYAKQHE